MRNSECGIEMECRSRHDAPPEIPHSAFHVPHSRSLMALLESIAGPADGKRHSEDQVQPLADEVRRGLIDVGSQTGGHIGAGLGVVELTVALCYCFDSPRDKIVWDVGHQGYPWKILTGRNDRLPTLRQMGGLSGFLRRGESPHDQFGAGHAGTGLAAAYGIAAARDLRGEQFKVVAVVGDGALTCGLPYEAMNNAGHSGRDIIMVLNVNGMSIAPNVGAKIGRASCRERVESYGDALASKTKSDGP